MQKQYDRRFIQSRLYEYWHLMRFDRPIGIFLLLWPTLWGLWIAGEGHPDVLNVCVFIAGVVLMRAAGCVINDYADREFDPHVERTQDRPVAAGRVSPKEALILFAILCLCAFALVLLLNRLTIYLSFVGVLLAASYPFMKRYTYFPQVFLGLAFGWAIPMAFAAQTGSIPKVAWLLYIATILWALAYDTMYAMVDIDDDLKIGVKSTAILFGDLDRVFIALIQASVLITLVVVGLLQSMSLPYYAGLLIALMFGLYQLTLIYDRSKQGCLHAFLNNNKFGASIFLGIVVSYFF